MFENFSAMLRKAMNLARQEAKAYNSEFIGTEHILMAIIQDQGIAAMTLKALNVDLKRIRQEVVKLITPSTSPTVTLGPLPFSPRAKHAIELAGEEATKRNETVIGTEHMLLGIMREPETIAFQVLTKLGLTCDKVSEMIYESPYTEGAVRPEEDRPFELHLFGDRGQVFEIALKTKPTFNRLEDGREVVEWEEDGKKFSLVVSRSHSIYTISPK